MAQSNTDILIVDSYPHRSTYDAVHKSIISFALKKSGLTSKKVAFTSLFANVPPREDAVHFFNNRSSFKAIAKKKLPSLKEKDFKDIFAGHADATILNHFPQVKYGLFGSVGFLKQEYVAAIPRLLNRIKELNPTIIIALGPIPLWALTKFVGIEDYRGVPLLANNRKLIATYHPSTIRLRWALRFVMLADFRRAFRESSSPFIATRDRTIYIPETPAEYGNYISTKILTSPQVAIDVETAARQITCFSMAPSPTEAIVVPIWNEANPDFSHWAYDDELAIWEHTARVLQNKQDVVCIFHNEMYDIPYFYAHGIKTTAKTADTMLTHHAMQPEIKKSLGFLSSLYIPDVGVWKPLGNFSTADKKTLKSYV